MRVSMAYFATPLIHELTLRIAAGWLPPRGDEINHSFTIRAQAGIGEGSDLGGRYGIPHLLVSQNPARDRNRHRNGRRHPGEVTVLQSQRRLFLLPRDTRAQDQRRPPLQDAASAIANSLHGVAVRRGRCRCARPTHATEGDSTLTAAMWSKTAPRRYGKCLSLKSSIINIGKA
jgi:hypothetical protein